MLMDIFDILKGSFNMMVWYLPTAMISQVEPKRRFKGYWLSPSAAVKNEAGNGWLTFTGSA